MNIKIMPHQWEESGRKHSAQCFPFVNGRPIHSIARCEYCALFKTDDDICDGWKDAPNDTPLFCGPICPRFDLIPSKKKFIKEVLG